MWVTTGGQEATSFSQGDFSGSHPESVTGEAQPSSLADEMIGIRELLRLSPDGDAVMVRRTLAEVLKNSRDRAETIVEKQASPWNFSSTHVTYTERFGKRTPNDEQVNPFLMTPHTKLPSAR